MARLPIPGSDSNTWGSILNDYLDVIHNSDGSLKNNSVGTNQLQNGAVSTAKLDSTLQTSISNANNSLSDSGVAAAINNSNSATATALTTNYASKNHIHTISQVTSLQSNLDGKSLISYTSAVLKESGGSYGARPTGYANVKFIGATDPGSLAQDGDEWIQLT